MPDDSNNLPVGGAKSKDKKHKRESSTNGKLDLSPMVKAADDAGRAAKEHEPVDSTDKAIKEIQEIERDASREVERKVKEDIGEEARLREPEIEIPPDVADAGVKSPDEEASKALEKGAATELLLTEKEYKEGLGTKITAKVNQKREVYGVKSILALAIYVGRMMKQLHHHAKSFVFRKEGG